MKEYVFTFRVEPRYFEYQRLKVIASAETAEKALDKAEKEAKSKSGFVISGPTLVDVEILGNN